MGGGGTVRMAGIGQGWDWNEEEDWGVGSKVFLAEAAGKGSNLFTKSDKQLRMESMEYKNIPVYKTRKYNCSTIATEFFFVLSCTKSLIN